jgi:GNAT superfamily N-acetyltransferase
MPEEVRLRDGTRAWVLALDHSDRQRLAEEFEHLSLSSRRTRFLTPVDRLSESMLAHLVDEVDGIDHVALVLCAETADDVFEPVGIGRMVRYPDLPDAADLAVTVQDHWQGRGVATALLPVLVRMRPKGVTRVLTAVIADNQSSLAMLRRLGPTAVHYTGVGMLDVEVRLDPGRDGGNAVANGLDEPRPSCPEPATTDGERSVPVGTRLHPVLADPRRAALRNRDLVCPWSTDHTV